MRSPWSWKLPASQSEHHVELQLLLHRDTLHQRQTIQTEESANASARAHYDGCTRGALRAVLAHEQTAETVTGEQTQLQHQWKDEAWHARTCSPNVRDAARGHGMPQSAGGGSGRRPPSTKE